MVYFFLRCGAWCKYEMLTHFFAQFHREKKWKPYVQNLSLINHYQTYKLKFFDAVVRHIPRRKKFGSPPKFRILCSISLLVFLFGFIFRHSTNRFHQRSNFSYPIQKVVFRKLSQNTKLRFFFIKKKKRENFILDWSKKNSI